MDLNNKRVLVDMNPMPGIVGVRREYTLRHHTHTLNDTLNPSSLHQSTYWTALTCFLSGGIQNPVETHVEHRQDLHTDT